MIIIDHRNNGQIIGGKLMKKFQINKPQTKKKTMNIISESPIAKEKKVDIKNK